MLLCIMENDLALLVKQCSGEWSAGMSTCTEHFLRCSVETQLTSLCIYSFTFCSALYLLPFCTSYIFILSCFWLVWSTPFIKAVSRRHITTGLKCTLTAARYAVFSLLLQIYTLPYRSCLPISLVYSWMHNVFSAVSPLGYWTRSISTHSHTQSSKGCWEFMFEYGMHVCLCRWNSKCLNDYESSCTFERAHLTRG